MALEARTTTLFDQGFSDGIKDKDEAVSKLMEKFLLTAQGAFLDKVNGILKVDLWQFGSLATCFRAGSPTSMRERRGITLSKLKVNWRRARRP